MKQPLLKTYSAILAVPLVMAVSGSAFAQQGDFSAMGPFDGAALAQARNTNGPGQGVEQRREAFLKKLQQELGLSDSQMQELETLKNQRKEQGQALHEQLRTKRKAMADYIKTPNATEAGALQRFREVNEIQRKLGELRLQTFFDMREKLTPEQAARFADMMDRKMQPSDEPGGRQGSPRQRPWRGNGGASR